MFQFENHTTVSNYRWLVAALFYIGAGLVLLAITPETTSLQASDACGTCPEGQICVQVGEGYECQCPSEPTE